MELLLNGRRYALDDCIGAGGEGEIYRLLDNLAAKKYYPAILSSDLRLKVLALCNSYSNNIKDLGSHYFAFPQAPAYESEEKLDHLCGFGMHLFTGCAVFSDIGYDLAAHAFRPAGGAALDDDRAVELVYNTFDVVDRLHKARVILGDVNPNNLLYNRHSNFPIIIDVDSAQVGQFKCLTWSDEYLDPLIEQQGKNSHGGYTYSFESDVFSLACVLFELIIGIHPYCVTTNPPIGIPRNKELGLSRLSIVERQPLPRGVVYVQKAADSSIEARLNALRSRWPKLYSFFASVFLHGRRANLMESLERSDPRHPAYVFYSKSGFDRAWEEWLDSQRAARAAAATRPQTAPFSVPESGFISAVKAACAKAAMTAKEFNAPAPQPMPALDTAQTDPPALSVFLSQYEVNVAGALEAA